MAIDLYGFDPSVLSDDFKAKAKDITSAQELQQLVMDEGLALTDEQLELISGGISWQEIWDELSLAPGDERDYIDESLVSEAFKRGEDLGDEIGA